jgi:hypothetical protein
MQVQFNTDRNIDASKLSTDLESQLRQGLSIYEDKITRLEVHLRDDNAHKSGPADKTCTLEARLAGLQPIAVDHTADTVATAVNGALQKLRNALESTLGKLGRRK